MPATDITLEQLFGATGAGGGTVAGSAVTAPTAVLAGTNDGLAMVAWVLDSLFKGYGALNPSVISRTIREVGGKTEIKYSVTLLADTADIAGVFAGAVDQIQTS